MSENQKKVWITGASSGIGKATAKAGESSGNLATFLTEIFKGSKMIRIYQKENQENKNEDIYSNIDEMLSSTLKPDDNK